MYIPKNKIITNLYSEDNQLVFKGTNKVYKGHYWKNDKDQYFTGKNPNDKPSEELEFIENVEDTTQPPLTETTQIAFRDSPTPFKNINEEGYNEELIVNYSKTQQINLNKPNVFKLPQHHIPNPTEKDYKLGSFTRYFVVKINENKFIEINQDTFNKIRNKDEEYLHKYYIPFKLTWTLIGEPQAVFTINKNEVLLKEQRLRRKGLQQFLRGNYLKFVKDN